jgi:N utilization substance protein B
VALQVLYGLDLASRADARRDAQEAFDEVARHFELPEGARAFAKELVLGVCAQRERLDALLAEHARNWRVERMAAVDRNVLRLGAYELLSSEVPAAVVIDEAVALARRFGDDPSPRFVNGVLDAVARQVRPPEPPERGSEEVEG